MTLSACSKPNGAPRSQLRCRSSRSAHRAARQRRPHAGWRARATRRARGPLREQLLEICGAPDRRRPISPLRSAPSTETFYSPCASRTFRASWEGGHVRAPRRDERRRPSGRRLPRSARRPPIRLKGSRPGSSRAHVRSALTRIHRKPRAQAPSHRRPAGCRHGRPSSARRCRRPPLSVLADA